MTAWPKAQIKSSVSAAFYPCCASAELLVAKVSIGERRESSGVSTGRKLSAGPGQGSTSYLSDSEVSESGFQIYYIRVTACQ